MADNFDHAITLSVKLEADDVKQTSQELQQKIQGVFSGMGDKASVPFLKLQASMSRVVSSAQRLQRSMDALKTQPTAEFAEMTNKLQTLQASYRQAAQDISKMQELMAKGKDVDPNMYQAATNNLRTYDNQIKIVQAHMQEMRTAGTAFQVPDTAVGTYQNLASKLGDVNNRMRILLETESAMTQREREQADAAREAAKAQEEEAQAKAKAARQQTVYNTIMNTATQVFNKFIGMIRGMIDQIKRATIFVGQLAKKMMSVVGSAIQRGFERLAKSIRNVSHATDSSNFNFKKALRIIIQYGIGVRSLYFLFRKLRSAIAEGFENLIKFRDGETSIAHSIEGLKNNLIYLKNAWAAAFAPLVEYVMPAVNAAIDKLADFAHMIGGVFAQLTGKTTMIKAVKNMDGYADSTEEAAEEQKKLNRELFSWDELNRQQDDTTKATKDLAKANEANNMFEEVPVENMLPEWLIDWLDKLKKLWDDGAWFEIGKHIADLINRGLLYLDNWINNTFAPWIKTWTNRIVEIINGLIEGLNWKLLGKTIGDFVNAVVDALYDFFTKVHWEKLGRGIGTALVSMFQTVDWEKVGATFAARWNALIKFIYGLVTTPDIWKEMGLAIAGFINGWFTEADFEKAALTLAATINGVFETIREIVSNTDIPAGLERIAKAINTFFGATDWKSNGETIAQVFNMVVEAFTRFFVELDGELMGHSFGDFLASIFGNIDVDGVLALISSVWDEIKSFVSSLFERLDIDTDALLKDAPRIAKALGEMVAEAANELLTSDILHQLIVTIGTFFVTVFANLKWGEIKMRLYKDLQEIFKNVDVEKLGSTLLGVFKKAIMIVVGSNIIKGAAQGIGKLIVSGISELITSGIPSLFSTVFSAGFWAPGATAAGASVGMAILEGLSTAVLGIPTIIAGWNLGTLISDAFMGASEEEKSFSAFTQAIKDAFTDPDLNLSISGFGSFVSEQSGNIYDNMLAMADKTQPIFDAFTTTFEKSLNALVLGFGAFIIDWDGIKEYLADSWTYLTQHGSKTTEELRASLGEVFNGMADAYAEIWNNIKQFLSDKWNGIKTTADEIWNGIKQFLSDIWTGIKDTASEIWTAISTALTEVWNGLKDTASTVWDSIKIAVSDAIDNVKNKMGGVKDFFNDQIEGWKNFGRNIVDGIKKGISDAWDGLKSFWDDTIGSLIDGAKDILGISSPSKVFAQIGRYVDEGLMEGISDQSDGVLNEMSRLTNGLANTPIPSFEKLSNIKLPAVATGTVVPAMATSYPGGYGGGGFDESSLDRLAEILSNAMSGLSPTGQGGGGGQQVISVNVSGREIFNAVVDENNRALQRTGISPIRV